MLARHAEDLFWIGRYLERAEDTARMLDVTYHGVLEEASERSASELWAELLEVLFLEEDVEAMGAHAGEAVGELLIADREYSGSIVTIVGRARENARTTREWLAVEVWEMINELHLRLERIDLVGASRTRPYDVLREVKNACQAVNGAVDASMPRSEGYRFFLSGQRLERALMTVRVLGVWHRRLGGFGSHAAFAEWVKLLRSVSAYEAYLREYRASMEGSKVLSFLLQAHDFPRSVLHCLSRVEQLLSDLDTAELGGSLRRRVGRLRSEVEFSDPSGLGPQLGYFLEQVELGIVELTAEIDRAYFRPGAMSAMHAYEAF
jgi:uncharacterized alpha-E superfamily protein